MNMLWIQPELEYDQALFKNWINVLNIQELTKTQKSSQTHIETHFEQQTHGQKLKNTTYSIYTHGGRDQNSKNNQFAPIKIE